MTRLQKRVWESLVVTLAMVAVIVAVIAVWTTALTAGHRGAGIPTGFMSLIFWSLLLAQVVAHSSGVLLGYWQARIHARSGHREQHPQAPLRAR